MTTSNLGVDGQTIGEMFTNRAKASPDAPAFQTKRDGTWQTITWGDAFAQAQDVAAGLLTLGVQQAFAAGAERVWLHTCTLDGPTALPNYQARGMTIYKTTTGQQRVDRNTE
jgi:long-subunit acyl-CoA synthetase (AMP-forming)